ncbi:hypothetical protein K474DRAFT_1613374 [Panus rudis PR-1116 ss-1]|nr:hypothetical protein K474DRAFT_1613374 [Panus rudis PR-1116 ss-1]
MSVVRAGKRSMRIIALPLCTHTRTATGRDSHLTYYHFVTPPPKEPKKQGWTDWATAKAADLWAGFGKAPEGTWKRKTFLYGERLVDRIDFEELALKSIDTSLGPKLFSKRPDASATEDSAQSSSTTHSIPTIPLIYPGAVCNSPMAHFRSLLEKRTPRHKRGAWFWLLISPLTAPFMIIPVIPNLPFFFCIWRSWHHYSAYKASAFLEQFVKRDAIKPIASPELDKIYAEYAPRPTPPSEAPQTADLDTDASSTPTSTLHPSVSERPPVAESEKCHPNTGSPQTDTTPKRLLLSKEAVPEIMKLFDIPPESTFAADVYRALEQARLRMDEENKRR